MDRVTMLPRLGLCVLLLLSVWHGAHGARVLRAGIQGQLPPCKDVPGGIPNWDCFDPPSTPLPPCDFKHHSPGIDCNTDGQKPPSPKAKLAVTILSGAGGASTHHGIQGQLPPCKDVPGGIPNWDCFDPPRTPLPPCDFKHHSPGIDCNTDGQKPPSPKAKLAVTILSGAGGASTHYGIQGQLPPCKDVPGGIPNWDCFDPPSTPLPPCDFKHHSPGIDCNTDGQKPPSPKAKLAGALPC
jgi:hypothetical protein